MWNRVCDYIDMLCDDSLMLAWNRTSVMCHPISSVFISVIISNSNGESG